MAEYDWPESLPNFLVEGYAGGGGDDGVLRSKLGRASKIRPQYTTAPPELLTPSVICTKAQLQVLVEFYSVTLGRVLPFNFRDFTKPDVETVEYRFTGRPSWVPAGSGALWRVTLPLEQLTQYQGTFPLDIEGLAT